MDVLIFFILHVHFLFTTVPCFCLVDLIIVNANNSNGILGATYCQPTLSQIGRKALKLERIFSMKNNCYFKFSSGDLNFLINTVITFQQSGCCLACPAVWMFDQLQSTSTKSKMSM